MFNKLKECKTIAEIYGVLGEKWFSDVAGYVLFVWALIPVIAGVIDMIIHFVYKEFSGFTLSLYASYYTWLVTIAGAVSIVFWLSSTMGKLRFQRRTLYQSFDIKYRNEIWIFLLLLMWGWSFLSSLLAPAWGISFAGSEFRFDGFFTYCFYAGAFGCAYYVTSKSLVNRFYFVFAIVGDILAFVALFGEKHIPVFEQIQVAIYTSVFMNENHYGYFLTMVIMVILGLYYKSLNEESYKEKKSKQNTVFYIVSFAVQIYTLMKNDTMGAYVAIVISMIILLVCVRKRINKTRLLHIIPLIILIVFTVLSSVGVITSVLGETIGQSLVVLWQDVFKVAKKSDDMDQAGTNRIFLWKQAIEMIKRKPLFGWGPEGLQGEYKAITGVDRPHNEYLQHAAFLGIPALLMYLSALFSLCFDRIRKIHSVPYEQLIAGGVTIAYLISAFFGNTLFYTTPYFFIFLGITAASLDKE